MLDPDAFDYGDRALRGERLRLEKVSACFRLNYLRTKMFETLLPYLTVLPSGVALLISLLGVVPSVIIAVRSNKAPPSRESALAGVAILVGGWAFFNFAIPLFPA